MGKTVYSLVLTDEVIEEIDRLAYTMGTSRSALIDRILAEKVSYTTPEMRIDRIFDSLNRLFSDTSDGFIAKAENQSMLIRSSLKYKYKPTVRYSLQLLRKNESTEGEIKVSFRTQSLELISKMEMFLQVWAGLENKYIVKYFPKGIQYYIEEGRFTRRFTLPDHYKDKSSEEIGAAIAQYIRMFDDVLKCYFACDTHEEGIKKATERYEEYLKNGIEVI